MANSLSDLGRAMKAKHPGAYDDIPDDELGRAIQKKNPGAYDDFVSGPATMATPQMSRSLPRVPMVGSGSPIGDLALRTLPTVGGILGGIGGGMVGGPVGAIGGAAAGGAGGEGLREMGLGEPISPSRMVNQAAWQGGAALTGGVLGGAAQAVGPGATRLAALLRNPMAMKAARAASRLSPVGGAVSGGIPGAAAGAVLPYAGRAAMKVATSPKTAAFLSSRAFQAFARYSPQAATQLAQQVLYTEQPDATGW